MAKRQELKYQKVIIKSYKEQAGMAEHWNNEWIKGPPDLICCIQSPRLGVHLVEVKHLPTLSKVIQNPMTPKQQEYAKKYIDAGGAVFLAIVKNEARASRDSRDGVDNVTTSKLAFFNARSKMIDPQRALWVPYVLGKGYDIMRALKNCEQQPYGLREL